MVVGTGLLATIFKAYKTSDEVLIFASGVSNSKETNQEAFNREIDLLKTTIASYPKAKIVYFSTVSITDPSVNKSAYVQHKLTIEEYIKATAAQYLILRVSNVVGAKGNPNTIMNFLVSAVKEQQPVTIWTKAERNMIDVADVYIIAHSLLERQTTNTTVNVAVRNSLPVRQMLTVIEEYCNKSAQVTYVDKGSPLPIEVTQIEAELEQIEANSGIGTEYVFSLLKKYY